jgi:hypothetical protein
VINMSYKSLYDAGPSSPTPTQYGDDYKTGHFVVSNRQGQTVAESFSWITPSMTVEEKPGAANFIRGKCLYSIEEFGLQGISQNMRKYIDDELKQSARTLSNQPVDVNHAYNEWLQGGKQGSKPILVGNVEFANHEDGAIEYVAKITNPVYANKLRDSQLVREGELTEAAYFSKWGKGPIRGVSVEANFLWMRCGECSTRFYDVNEYHQHMKHEHNISEAVLEPHGLIFKGLSLVESPEEPGVRDTTFELVETMQPQAQLYETLIQDYQEITGGIEEMDNEDLVALNQRLQQQITELTNTGTGKLHLDPSKPRHPTLPPLSTAKEGYDAKLEEIEGAFQQYKQVMDENVLQGLRELKALFVAYEKRLDYLEAKVNVASDNSVKEMANVDVWKEALETRLDNAEDRIKQMAVFKAPHRNMIRDDTPVDFTYEKKASD